LAPAGRVLKISLPGRFLIFAAFKIRLRLHQRWGLRRRRRGLATDQFRQYRLNELTPYSVPPLTDLAVVLLKLNRRGSDMMACR
jgi:hypothetical protein